MTAAGWMVTVGIIKDDNSVGHIVYAVALADPTEAIGAALRSCSGEAAAINHELSKTQLQDLGLNAGEVLAIYDDKTDPITSGTLRH
ncbi:hypothetical protein HAP47_0000310 [Bradyrhizobium sp. 41S5]|uniref:hypothetical protein n=1 Tax=Bradyrhizobium sp. 41S5 TaxID=1404443 RepID=UPI00156B57ED|nr:hypothetical protein [Bradyrhizobium sp. 41S5]UFX45221.1 hypothetical protein HAP47_0000310 [Bradyrhizobium sp. 41S5]